MQKKHESAITVAEIKQIRRIREKTRLGRIYNETIRESFNQEAVMKRINKRKLNWYGHIIKNEKRPSS